MTILIHQLNNNQYTMATRLINRGSNKNYVNSNGKTPLHFFIESKLIQQCKYLLANKADPHIMDLTGMDVCDKV